MRISAMLSASLSSLQSRMRHKNCRSARFWNILAKAIVLLAFLLFLWWLVNGEWLWIFLNAIWQREWG